MDMAGYAFRPFGSHKGDLDIDFDSPRPELVSDLLHACWAGQGSLDPADLESLPVGERLALLIELVRASGQEILSTTLTCGSQSCGQSFEIELDLSSLLEMHRQAGREEVVKTRVDGERLMLRRPTAEDQHLWRRSGYSNSKAAADEMLLSLIVESEVVLDSPVPETIVRAIEKAMRAADPLMAPTINSQCPDCGHRQEGLLDLGWILLGNLEKIQRDKIEAIHQLAKSYHWTEEQILALPGWRREQYLKLIEREG